MSNSTDNTFPYTTPEQQIQKLKEQKLIFSDEEAAKRALKIWGYYNIINGYREPYLIREYGQKRYYPGTTFEQIFGLFQLDHSIREGVLTAMIDLEEHLRAVVADIVAEDFGTDHHLYLQNNNYRDKFVRNPKFRRNNILANMKDTAEHADTQPIKYYREYHGIVPPWILLKGVFFATLTNFIRFFKSAQRTKLVHALYGNDVPDDELDFYKDLLADTFSMCVEYRNCAAHGGRIYNYIPKSTIRSLEGSEFAHGLPQLLHVLSLLEYDLPYKKLDSAVASALNNYCPMFPNDLELLENAMGLHIYKENQVWINPNTHKYHSIQHCSGNHTSIRIPLETAKELGYSACKKCCILSNNGAV